MAPISPRSSNYERLKGGMGPTRTDPGQQRLRWFGWKKFAIGATLLIGVVYLFGPREATLVGLGGGGGGGRKKAVRYPYDTIQTDPLPGPPEPLPPAQARPPRPPTSHPKSFATDPDPALTTYCTTPHPSAPAGRLVTYALMLDAGSIGSRIHVYKFNHCSASPAFEYEVFMMTWRSLFSFAGDPQGAARSLDVLMDKAVRVVPKKLHKCTPVAVKAAAVLRFLPGSQSKDILEAVEDRLKTHYPFQVLEKDGVVIMDGKDQGVYAWITANYLLGTISSSPPSPADSNSNSNPATYAVLYLGGASTQIVFEPQFPQDNDNDNEDNTGAKLEDGEHKYTLNFTSRTHTLYHHFYLGYGLQNARAHVHLLVEFMQSIRPVSGSGSGSSGVSGAKELEQPIVPNPCLARGTRKTVEIDGKGGVGKGAKRNVIMDGGDVGGFEGCDRVVQLVLAKDAICELKPCSFGGVYQPSLLDSFPPGSGKVLLLSYFYDRIKPLLPLPASLSPSPSTSTTSSPITVSTLALLAQTICTGHPSWLAAYGTNTALMAELQGRPEWCLDLTFMHALLRLGFEFEDTREVELGKQVRGTELGWCLGATIAMVGGELKCRA